MKYSYHWLKELSGTKKSPDQLAKLLMMHAFEVESVEKFPHGLSDIVIGEVAALAPHPNADRLRVATVCTGKDAEHTIVCGAPNIEAGQKVAVALPGTVLPGGMEIGEAKLRGVLSQGMICSERELGLGENHEGILVLPEDAPTGALFAKHYKLDDSILDIKILPDRGSDALSYEGMAREIAALDGHAPRFDEKPRKIVKIPAYNRAPKVLLADKKACSRYVGLSFQGVKINESPLWLKLKLFLSGLRPINNVVDATNYLMLLTGQPMHAFDADKISGPVSVRFAKKNEKLTLLSGATIKLHPEDLVIADAKKALALAGVMGGNLSAVTPETENIFLEIAVFDPATVRRTKMRHGLPTDASYRFERGLDPNLPTDALREAAMLLTSLTGGKLMGLRDVYPKAVKPWKIRLSLERVEEMLGTKVPLFEAVQYLALLGLKVKKMADRNILEVTVPTRRPDLLDEWDLIEEIGRMRGYEKIPALAPILPLTPREPAPGKTFERALKTYLADSGFDEIMTYSFYAVKDAEAARLPADKHLVLENPLSPEHSWLRLSLSPTMLRKVRENLRYQEAFSCFEYGSVFRAAGKSETPSERKEVLLASVIEKSEEKGSAFFALKGSVAAMLEKLGCQDASFERLTPEHVYLTAAMLHPTRSAVIKSGDKVIGLMGELHPSVAKSFGLPEGRVALAGFHVEALSELQKETPLFTPLQKFPSVFRDVSLTFPKTVIVGAAESVIRKAGEPLLRSLELFDIYEQEGEKSLAFHLAFGAEDRTLTAEEADQAMQAIVSHIHTELQGYLRA